MRLRVLLASVSVLCAFSIAVPYAQSPSPAASAEAAKLKNPVRANASSVAAGKKLYDGQCASCHGTAGKGDGKGGAILKPKPSDLTDAEWKHGATDGHLFVVVRDGIEKTAMRGYAARMTTNDIWHIVNYVRTLGSKPSPSH